MKRLNKKEWKKTTKYIAGSAGAVSLAVASCVAGITGGTDVTKYDKEYLAGDDKASDTDATTVMNTDELADTLADNVNMTEKDVDKDETVYVFAKANGDVDNILVNETLKNRDKADKIEDTTDLKDIVNVKGDETFTQDGNKITWDAAGNEISYQGTTDKELPVDVKATYYLDGNEIAPEDLAGKSGKVKIRLDYTSNETVTKEVNGKDEDISVPFVAVSGMVLGDNFKNIQVTNGKYITQGESNIVVGYAIPGLDDGVKDAAADLDTELPEYVEVSADVTDFSLDMTVTLLVNGSEMNFSGGVDLTDLDKLTDSLSSAGDQLADGSGELSDGATQVSDGAGQLSDGAGQLASGAGTLADKMGDLTSGAGSLKAGMESLSSSSGDLASGVAIIDQSAQSIANGINTLDAAVNAKMTDEEKAAVQKQAADQVSAQLAEGTDMYNAIYNGAVSAYTQNMSGAKDDLVAAYSAKDPETGADSLLTQMTGALLLQGATESATKAKDAASATSEANAKALVYQAAYEAAKANGVTDKDTLNAIATAAADAVKTQIGSYIEGATFASTFSSYTGSDQNKAAAAQAASATINNLADKTTKAIGSNAKAQATIGSAVVAACKTSASTAAGSAAVQGAETAKATIASQIEATQANGYSLVSGANALAKGTSTLAGSVPALKNGISQLVNGANALASGAGQLKDGAVSLKNGAGTLKTGVDQLKDGAGQVADGAATLNESLVTLNDEAIKKMINAYNGDVKDSVERLQAAMEAATEYDSFGGKADNTAGVTKFIIKTAAISAE